MATTTVNCCLYSCELLFLCFTQYGGSSYGLNFDKFLDTVCVKHYYCNYFFGKLHLLVVTAVYHFLFFQGTLTRKFSSCSTIFLDDSTVSQPNLKSTIKWYSNAAVTFNVDLNIMSRKFKKNYLCFCQLLTFYT